MHHHLDTGFSLPGARGSRRAGPEDFRRYLTHMLGWGFTTIFSTAHACADLEDFTDLRRAAQDGEPPMARHFGVGRGITIERGHASQPPLAAFLPKTPEEARQQVHQLKTAGVDAVKLIVEDLRWHGMDVPVMRRDVMQAVMTTDMRVLKSGRSTGVTEGVIERVTGSAVRIHLVRAFPLAYELAEVGDSGAVWVEQATRSPVALHIAGTTSGPSVASAVDINAVLATLGLRMVR